MKVYELIEKLNQYNQNANIDVTVNGFSKEFKIYYSGSENCSPINCNNVILAVDAPCEEDQERKDKRND